LDEANITYFIQIFEPVDDKNVSEVKNSGMKLLRFLSIFGIALFLFSCSNRENELSVINSVSFPEKNITLDNSITQRLLTDSAVHIPGQNQLSIKLDEMISVADGLRKNQSDSLWNALSANWYDFGKEGLSVLSTDSLSNSEVSVIANKWAELNIILLKLSGEVKFGDAIDDLLYQFPNLVCTEKQLKSIIYTHIDDQIFINLFGASTLTHWHTTGGTVQLIQKTEYPFTNEIALFCECSDTRYLDVFIRIPEWAVNPTVTHGNVKYVARPGEYCQVSRKWNNGDEFLIKLKN
jgi:hypothetical protein